MNTNEMLTIDELKQCKKFGTIIFLPSVIIWGISLFLINIIPKVFAFILIAVFGFLTFFFFIYLETVEFQIDNYDLYARELKEIIERYL